MLALRKLLHRRSELYHCPPLPNYREGKVTVVVAAGFSLEANTLKTYCVPYR